MPTAEVQPGGGEQPGGWFGASRDRTSAGATVDRAQGQERKQRQRITQDGGMSERKEEKQKVEEKEEEEDFYTKEG